MTFWLIAAALLVGVALLVVVPAWRAPRLARDPAVEDQLRRFTELDADVADGEVDAAEAPALRAELERAVVDAVPRAETRLEDGNRWGLTLVVLVVLAAAVPIYHELGMPRLAALGLNTARIDQHQSLDVLLERVRARTREEPEDREAWTMLARSTLALGRYDEAVAAAERAHALAADDVSGMLLLVDALAMRGQGRIDERARELLARVLDAEPDNPTGLVLSGIAAQQRGADAEAAAAWRRALAVLPADAPFRGELTEMLARVSPASPAAADTAAPVASAPDGLAVTARVRLDTRLDAPADATVFVIARAVEGPPAPLAVARHRVDELPLEVTLDDSMAMVPGASLSSAQQVTIVARVSRSGNARAASGDLVGQSGPFDPRRMNAVEVVIDGVEP